MIYLSDLIKRNNQRQNVYLGEVCEKVVFNSNPIIKHDPAAPEEIVTKGYLLKTLEKIFGPNFYESNFHSYHPVAIYLFKFSNAECIEGEDLIFELIVAPELIAETVLKLDIISNNALPGVDFINSLYYSKDNIEYISAQDNIISFSSNTTKLYIKLETLEYDSIEFYGDKVLILKINEILNYESPENPYFIFNDIGIGTIKEKHEKPKTYNLTISNPFIDKGGFLIFELKLNHIISNLKLLIEINNLTAFDGLDYSNTDIKYGELGSWNDGNIIQIQNSDKVLVRVRTIDRKSYQGDKVLLLNLKEILEKPDNSNINIINSLAYGTIKEKYLPESTAFLNVHDAYCNEGEDLIFETEIIIPPPHNIIESDIVIHYDVKNLTALSGLDYNEVMYYSFNNTDNFIQTSTRQVVYTNSNRKIFIKIPTIKNNNITTSRSLLLKPLNILAKPNNLNLHATDIGIGSINTTQLLLDEYVLSIDDAETYEGSDIVFNINSNKNLNESIILNIKTNNITAHDTVDFEQKSLQYSINQGSTWINATHNNIIFYNDLQQIKIKYSTIRNVNYTGWKSFLVKIKKVVSKPLNFTINHSDNAVGIIKDLEEPPVNHKISFVDKDFSVTDGNDFIFEGFIYPPLRYDGLELKLKMVELSENNTTSFSLKFGSFSTNNGLTWSTISQNDTIILNKNTNYFKIKVPTYRGISNIKNIKFEIEKVVFLTPNSNFDLSESFIDTFINKG